jgi:endonuclease G
MTMNMKKASKRITLLALFLLFPIFLFGQDFRYAPETKGTLIQNLYYCLDFNSEHKQANWVYYMLTQTHISGDAQRYSTFKDCKLGDVVSASQKDYKGSGYDKGHLCPAADMKLSKEAMKETFQMWNMSPQVPSFNRGKWSELEALVRSYIKDETDTLFIVTGAIFTDNKGSIGDGKVTVPSMFYKVV